MSTAVCEGFTEPSVQPPGRRDSPCVQALGAQRGRSGLCPALRLAVGLVLHRRRRARFNTNCRGRKGGQMSTVWRNSMRLGTKQKAWMETRLTCRGLIGKQRRNHVRNLIRRRLGVCIGEVSPQRAVYLRDCSAWIHIFLDFVLILFNFNIFFSICSLFYNVYTS